MVGKNISGNYSMRWVLALMAFVATICMPQAAIAIEALVDHEHVAVAGETVEARLVWENIKRDVEVEEPGRLDCTVNWTVYNYFGRELAQGKRKLQVDPGEQQIWQLTFPKDDWPVYRIELRLPGPNEPVELWRYVFTDGLGKPRIGGSRFTTNMLRGHYLWQWQTLDGTWEPMSPSGLILPR